MAEDWTKDEDGRPRDVLEQHRVRMAEDPAYRASALTPPGNHPPGGFADDVQRTADGDPVLSEEAAHPVADATKRARK
jgi:hypothetical protein